MTPFLFMCIFRFELHLHYFYFLSSMTHTLYYLSDAPNEPDSFILDLNNVRRFGGFSVVCTRLKSRGTRVGYLCRR